MPTFLGDETRFAQVHDRTFEEIGHQSRLGDGDDEGDDRVGELPLRVGVRVAAIPGEMPSHEFPRDHLMVKIQVVRNEREKTQRCIRTEHFPNAGREQLRKGNDA